jgi:glycopeptide antibiotics resistance protein
MKTTSAGGIHHMSLRIFTPALKVVWLTTMLLISLIEVVPFNSDNVPVIVFYSYKFLKAALFVAFGFETPLTFWRFDSIRAGLVMTLASALVIECIQNMSTGHSSSAVELLVKSALIMFGFVLAFNPRYDEELSVFGVHVQLIPSRKA